MNRKGGGADLVVPDVSVERGRDEAHEAIYVELPDGGELWRDIGGGRHVENITRPDQLSNKF